MTFLDVQKAASSSSRNCKYSFVYDVPICCAIFVLLLKHTTHTDSFLFFAVIAQIEFVSVFVVAERSGRPVGCGDENVAARCRQTFSDAVRRSQRAWRLCTHERHLQETVGNTRHLDNTQRLS